MKRRITAARATLVSLAIVSLLATSVPAIAGWAVVDNNPTSSFSTTVWNPTMYSWGWGRDGRTGVLALGIYETTPIRTNGLDRWSSVAAGAESTCGLTDDAHLYCWGDNGFGQLGTGDTVSHYEPIQVGSETWTSVVQGRGSTCAIKAADSTLWCWGSNAEGEAGFGVVSPSVVAPTQVSTTGLSTWSSVAAGEWYACGIKTDGSLWCWGKNTWGQLGIGDTTSMSVPSLVNAGPWLSVGTGFSNACAIKSVDHSLWCWGYGTYGQLGDGLGIHQSSPVSVSGGGTWSVVAPGQDHACGLKTDGTIWCWGLGDYGTLGNNDTAEEWEPTPVAGGISDWIGLIAQEYGSCAQRANRTLYCWGRNDVGQVGDGTTDDRWVPTLSGAGSNSWTTAIAGGHQHLCGVRVDQTLWCHGNNQDSQLGQDWGARASSPSPLGPPHTAWATGSMGHEGGCAIKLDASLWCWGINSQGSAGTGDLLTRPYPTMVGVDTDWQSVSVGSDATCAIKNDDSLWCWGDAEDGQLGVSTALTEVTEPAPGPAGAWRSVSVGLRHTCGITDAGGDLYCWGNNLVGQLGVGVGAGPSSGVPVQLAVSGVTGWASVSAGTDFSCAVAAAGTEVDGLFCWGENPYGQVGSGTTGTVHDVPLRVDAAAWRTVVAGAYDSCGVQTDGSLWCWGSNYSGELGIGGVPGSPAVASSPVQVGSATDWLAVAVGQSYACAVRTGNTVWCWGIGDYGQLGIRHSPTVTSPQQIPVLRAGWLGAHGNAMAMLAR